MSNYNKVTITEDTRTELHDKLSLTGAEVSINHLPAGASVPFVHAHKNNEEIYAILEGAGKAEIDGETVTLAVGDWLRISPAAKRRFFAAEDTGIRFLCIQSKSIHWEIIPKMMQLYNPDYKKPFSVRSERFFKQLSVTKIGFCKI